MSASPAVDPLVRIRQSVREFIRTNQITLNDEGLIMIFVGMVKFLQNVGKKANAIWYTGAALYLDKFAINDFLFSDFIGCQKYALEKVLEHPVFGKSALTKEQWEHMVAFDSAKGNRFDWHVYRYPASDILEEFFDLISKIDGECFPQATHTENERAPHLSVTKIGSFSISPEMNPRLAFGEKRMEEIMQLFAREVPEQKCWLLYRTDE